MKLDLNFKLENIELLGLPSTAEVSDDAVHAGRLLSSVLAKATETENPVKFWSWALDLYKKRPIEIDKSDMDLLKKFVKNNQQMFTIAKAQILNKIIEVENQKEAEA